MALASMGPRPSHSLGSAPAPDAAAPAKKRLLWPDVAKGLSILGVCLLHATMATPAGIDTSINRINSWLGPVRLPIFFLVSGLFSYKVRNQTLPQLWKSRIRFLLIPYLVWAPIQLWTTLIGTDEEIRIKDILLSVLYGECSLWFLHCLVIFTLAVWATKKLPDHWALASSVLPWLWLLTNTATPTQAHILNYLPVYFVGVFLRPALLWLARQWQSPILWMGSACLFWISYSLYTNLDTVYAAMSSVPVLNNEQAQIDTLFASLRALAAIPFCVLLCALLAQIRVLAKPLSYLGQHTLVIYLAHSTAVSLLVELPFRNQARTEAVLNMPEIVRVAIVLGAFGITLASGWVMEQFKRLPVLGWTIVPTIPFWQPIQWPQRLRTRNRGHRGHRGHSSGQQQPIDKRTAEKLR